MYWKRFTLCVDHNLELGTAYFIIGYIRIISMYKCVYNIIFDIPYIVLVFYQKSVPFMTLLHELPTHPVAKIVFFDFFIFEMRIYFLMRFYSI